jgi:hypothetical protein
VDIHPHPHFSNAAHQGHNTSSCPRSWSSSGDVLLGRRFPKAIAFLRSERAGAITSSAIHIDGGAKMLGSRATRPGTPAPDRGQARLRARRQERLRQRTVRSVMAICLWLLVLVRTSALPGGAQHLGRAKPTGLGDVKHHAVRA